MNSLYDKELFFLHCCHFYITILQIEFLTIFMYFYVQLFKCILEYIHISYTFPFEIHNPETTTIRYYYILI